MFEDLNKAIALRDTRVGAPNFMVALALCVYTEFWGRLLKGIPKGRSPECFNEFFKKLGKRYEELLDRKVDVYHDIRCGLVHSYMIENNAIVNMGTRVCGIEHSSNVYTFNIVTYYEDFKRAVDKYIQDVQRDNQLLTKLHEALKGKPTIA